MRTRTTIVLAVLALAVAIVLGSATLGLGAPTSPTDPTKVPHYFGPYSNWANSPQVLADAIVTITPAGGETIVATATATAAVEATSGAISTITVTSPGSGYTVAPNVSITSGVTPTTPAVATAVISLGVINAITVVESGFGFTAPAVTITGGNPTPGSEATATASGGVDDIQLTSAGSGYLIQPIVKFSLPDLPGGVQATGDATMTAGVVTAVSVVNPGSGYTSAPTVTIWDGGAPATTPAVAATAVATIGIGRIDVTFGGQGYDSAPTVAINDTVGVADKGASATATVAVKGAVTAINVTNPGAGYLTPGLKKFVDKLSGLGPTAANGLGNYIPVAVPDTTTYPGSDYYEIGLVQYRMRFSSQLPATLLRGYVQLSTSVVPGAGVALSNAILNSTATTPIVGFLGVDNPHYLGPTIVANKNRPVRILFRNLLPTGKAGNLFLPVDTTLMGSGMGPDMIQLDPTTNVPIDAAPDLGLVTDGVRNPACGEDPKPDMCFAENRATLHLHGGITPWISDGTPHQWITPTGEPSIYDAGVSMSNVPDMPDPGPGAQTFFYTNQQSARLMFYHDHAWGITRLNVYAGEAAGYLLTDSIEASLTAPTGALAGLGVGTPLVIQDKTFVPKNITATDPTWDATRWGGEGSLWTPHVYMPAQNPGDPSGMSAFGRWMYGPWFWPPAKDVKYPPIANPYYDAACDPNVQPFCEPALIPSTPNVSVGMEAFNDTPLVNGTVYPTTTVDPKAYRYRILNAANDRFWNLSWYVADPRTGTLSEVALNPVELAAAQTDPVVFPTPDTVNSPKGPSWVQIGTEGGFLPSPVVVPAQPTTWITDPTRFDVGNVDQHSLLLAPAERADVIVDFSQFRGKTLILYNDAPAAFPARVPGYDYYTGGPDLSPVGAPTTLPGYGPNTRTIMQVKVSTAAPALAWDRPNTTNDRMGALIAEFAHHLDPVTSKPAGVFESGSDPIIVGQAPYNSAYGSDFVANGWCNSATTPSARCDGYARIAEGSQPTDLFGFNTLLAPNAKMQIPFQPKGLHDEMNSASFDEWGRMTANLGLEAPGATPLLQNIILYPYVNPVTEILDATNAALPDSLHVTPISSALDGTQIWKITHNGVDTHPIHFHLYNVQMINRVTWDNIIIPPEPTELGWKETIRVSPLEDTIVAVRPIVPTIPFGVPDSKRPYNPMMPIGATGDPLSKLGTEAGFNNTDTKGNPIAPIVNNVVSFGWEYVYHCHILSHEEMDMMRPVTVAVASNAPDAPVLSFARGSVILTWTDGTPVDYLDPTTWAHLKNEVGYKIERAAVINGVVGTYTQIAMGLANTTTYTDLPPDPTTTYNYRVSAWNEAGSSPSNVITVVGLPAAPAGLTAVVQPAPALASGSRVKLDWVNNATNATNVVVERAVGAGAFAVYATLPPTDTTYTDTSVLPGPYSYRVNAVNAVGPSAYAGPVTVTVPQRASTTALVSSLNPSHVGDSVTFTATVTSAAASGTPTGNVTFSGGGVGATVVALNGSGVATFTTAALAAGTWTITADYAGDTVFTASTGSVSQIVNKTATTTALVSSLNPSNLGQNVTFTATVGPATASGTIQFNIDGAAAGTPQALVGGQATYSTAALAGGTHPVVAVYSGDPAFAASTSPTLTQTVVAPPAAPSGLAGTLLGAPLRVALTWTDNSANETGFAVQRSLNGGGFTNIAAVAANTTAYVDTTVAAGIALDNTYRYQVTAVNSAGPSAPSNMVTIVVPTIPAAPSGLARTITRTAAGPDTVALTWTDNATNEAGFTLQRATNTAFTTDLTTFPLGANVTAFTNTVLHGATYYYRIQAYNITGVSAWSGTVNVTTVPLTPTNFRSPSHNRTSIQLAWNDVSANETGYQIQRRRVGVANWSTIVTTAANVTTYNDTGRNPATSFDYRIRGRNGVGDSPWSPTIRVTTNP